MPKSIPTLGLADWGTPLNNHLSQLQNPSTGGINSFEQFSLRPINLTIDDVGKTYLYTQTGNIHQWTGTIWKVLNESVINVKDYGAIGDGETDNTAILQGLIAANLATSLQSTKTLFFPGGIYLVTDSLKLVDQINGGFGINILGDGFRNTIIIGNINKPIFDVSGIVIPPSNYNYRYPGYIKNLTIENKNLGVLASGVDASFTGNFFMEEVQINSNNIGLFASQELVTATFNKLT